MVLIIKTTAVPESITGYLSRYLAELESGFFVGRLSRRLGERLWDHICRHMREGHAIGVFSGGSELGYTIRVHNHPDLTIDDFDGLPMAVINRPRSTS